jgi:hypothetical protein
VFRPILNRTQNVRLGTDIQNLQCYPNEEVKQKWDKVQEATKNTGQVFEDVEPQAEGAAYEYYDETELNGTIFYFDMRYILNCSGEEKAAPNAQEASLTPNPTTSQGINQNTKVTSSPHINTISTTPKSILKHVPTNNGSLSETTTQLSKETERNKQDATNFINTGEELAKQKHNKDNAYTTTRLATVSAKPAENKNYDDHMASDEAKPDRLKAHRSIQEDLKHSTENKFNSGHKNDWLLPLFTAIIFSFRLFL